jgi:hypothetical protein
VRLTQRDIHELKDWANAAWREMPAACRLPGMRMDLTASERLTLASFQAALRMAARLGLLKDDRRDEPVEMDDRTFESVNDE